MEKEGKGNWEERAANRFFPRISSPKKMFENFGILTAGGCESISAAKSVGNFPFFLFPLCPA